MFATQLVNRADALFDGSRQPVTPRLIGITEDLLRHDSLNRCHGRILPLWPNREVSVANYTQPVKFEAINESQGSSNLQPTCVYAPLAACDNVTYTAPLGERTMSILPSGVLAPDGVLS